MRKLTALTVVSLAFALFAQDVTEEQQETVQQEVAQTQIQIGVPLEDFQALKQQMADLEQKLQETQNASSVATTEAKAEKKSEFPKIRHSGNINFISRMEVFTKKDSDGDDIKDTDGKFNANRRRLMLAWNYRINAAVNEKLDFGFRFADNAEGATISGSGVSLGTLLTAYIPNAWFTWKPDSKFNLSGGLVNVPSSTTLDLATIIEGRNPSSVFSNTYFNSLAGFDFVFPLSPSAKMFVTAGILDNSRHNVAPVVTKDETETLRSYSDGRIIFGADLSLADKKVSLKPSVQVRTRGALPNADTTKINSDRKPIVAEGIDMGLKFTNSFTLNAGFGAAHRIDINMEEGHELLFNAALEPVLNFGGEKGKLFNFRFKYGVFTLTDIKDDSDDNKNAMVNHIDTRLGIAVNEKLSIVPRYRLWAANNSATSNNYFLLTEDKDNKSKFNHSRFELIFMASF